MLAILCDESLKCCVPLFSKASNAIELLTVNVTGTPLNDDNTKLLFKIDNKNDNCKIKVLQRLELSSKHLKDNNL